MQIDIEIRAATTEDAAPLARLIDIAGHGLPRYFWDKAKPENMDVWSYGESRAKRTTGSFSYTNAHVAIQRSTVIGALMIYDIDAPCPEEDYEGMPDLFVPLQRLEDQAVGTVYLNAIAVFPEFQGQGIGGLLLQKLKQLSDRDISLIVLDSNRDAIRFYEREGFVTEATQPLVKEDWQVEGDAWVLMRLYRGSGWS